jgi:hypothetical protein
LHRDVTTHLRKDEPNGYTERNGDSNEYHVVFPSDGCKCLRSWGRSVNRSNVKAEKGDGGTLAKQVHGLDLAAIYVLCTFDGAGEAERNQEIHGHSCSNSSLVIGVKIDRFQRGFASKEY